MKIGEKIRFLRMQRGISPEKLGSRIGISGIYIRRLEKEQKRSITLATAQKLARGLDVPASALLDEDELPPPPVPSLTNALKDLEVSIKAYMPVYGEVSAGEGMEPIDYVASTRSKPAPDSMKAFRVKGLCLEPEIKDGDTVIVDSALAPQAGDLVVVIFGGQVSLKRYKEVPPDRVSEEGQSYRWLENEDGKYRPEDVHLVGVVTEFTRKRR